MKTITINGIDFELCKTGEINETQQAWHKRLTIDQAYSNPSTTKTEIYKEWLQFARETNASCFGISSYNCMMFTIGMYVNVGNNKYWLYITKAHNRAYKII